MLDYDTQYCNTIVSMSQDESCTSPEQGDIRVIGLTNEDVVGGRVMLCYNGWWTAVCPGGWDMNAAKVACRQILNLSQSGTQTRIGRASECSEQSHMQTLS